MEDVSKLVNMFGVSCYFAETILIENEGDLELSINAIRNHIFLMNSISSHQNNKK